MSPTAVESLFFAALEKATAAERAAYLDAACAGDTELRRQVEKMLNVHPKVGEFLNKPALEQLAGALESADSTQALDPSTDQKDAVTRTVGEGASDDDASDLGFLQPSTRPDSLGRIGHYEALQVLGKGGFGIVFRAFDDALQRVVALKVMAPQLAATSPARKRFLREARSSARVRHENVVQTYEVGEQPLPFLVMEFIPGETLQQRLDRVGPVDAAEVVRVGRQIAEGLAAAHATDLIHRDIKPGNILLEGGAQRVKITDFGLARAADDASISQSGIIAGTPMYMAPEQAKGEKLDHRADLFSLGSVLYQMAAGRPPFRANTTVAVLKRVAEDSPRDIREITPETPQWLCDIIAKLHAKNPDERYQSAREVADVLADCEAQLKANSKLKDYSRIPRGKARPSGRRKWVAAAAILLLMALTLAVTELAGVTRLLQGGPSVTDPHGAGGPAPNLAAGPGVPDADGWEQLFNGRDLTGWTTHPEQPGKWDVVSGTLVGRATQSHLFTERADFENFHLRTEVKVNNGGDTGIRFRVPFALSRGKLAWQVLPAGGYEAEFNRFAGASAATGSVWRVNPPFAPACLFHAEPGLLVQPDEWSVYEVIADGNRVVTKLNGRDVADCVDPQSMYATGRIALQCFSAKTVVQFRRIEFKPLPPSRPGSQPPTMFKNDFGMEFVRVPKGKAWLGGGEGRPGEQEVEFKEDFYLGKYEVTQEEWEKVTGLNPSHFSRTGDGKDAVRGAADADLRRFPVEHVSWDDCQEFVKLVNQRAKESGWVYRLPTSTEWEYACRGGPMSNKFESAFDFYFEKPGLQLRPAQANFDSALKRTCKAGSYAPNRLGLYDMHGNVWEWCVDEWKGDDAIPLRAHRGGCWDVGSGDCRAATGDGHPPSDRHASLGLRLARVPAGPASPEAKPPVTIAPFTEADVKRIAALPAAEQVEEVRKELMRRNAGFDGKAETKIEDGVVTELRINSDKVTDIAPIRVFDALRVLECRGTWNDKAGKPNGLLTDPTALKGMKLENLTHLDLSYSNVTDAGMVYFKDCKDLMELRLERTRVGDAGLNYFKDCKKLMRLNLAGTNVSDAGLAHFKGCKNLEHLSLDRTQVSDAGLDHLKDMPLRELTITSTGVTDLTPLKGMPLEDVRLTPKNITKGLDSLRDMKSLKTIGIDAHQAWPAAEFWKRYDKGEFK